VIGGDQEEGALRTGLRAVGCRQGTAAGRYFLIYRTLTISPAATVRKPGPANRLLWTREIYSVFAELIS